MARAEHRVLVVEDDPSLRDVVVEALSEDGHVVRAAPDGATALRIAGDWPPHLVVLDLMLPGLSGEQFCAALRELQGLADVLIVVVSAARRATEVSERLGATVMLRKPFDLIELAEQVDELLR